MDSKWTGPAHLQNNNCKVRSELDFIIEHDSKKDAGLPSSQEYVTIIIDITKKNGVGKVIRIDKKTPTRIKWIEEKLIAAVNSCRGQIQKTRSKTKKTRAFY